MCARLSTAGGARLALLPPGRTILPEQIRPPVPRALRRLGAAPLLDARVVARNKHLGHRVPLELLRPRVLRVLDTPPEPGENDSNSVASSAPSTPGRSLTTASTITIAGSSPPVST